MEILLRKRQTELDTDCVAFYKNHETFCDRSDRLNCLSPGAASSFTSNRVSIQAEVTMSFNSIKTGKRYTGSRDPDE